MIIILKPGLLMQIDHVVERVESLGFHAAPEPRHASHDIGVIGDESALQTSQFQAIAGVADVIRVLPAYKLASLEAHPEPSIVEVGGVRIGGGHLAMIAGPCAVELAERMDAIAGSVRASAPISFAVERSSRGRAPTPIKAWAKRG